VDCNYIKEINRLLSGEGILMEPNPIVNQQESLKGSNGQSGKMIALTFAAGGLLGTAVGMLLAPWKGSEAREMIAGMAGDLKEKTNGLS
jgi:hypothetical protein